jgi:HlyD family secretion protein
MQGRDLNIKKKREETMNLTTRRILAAVAVLVLAGAALVWYFLARDGSQADSAITASGTVEAVEVIISPEISGRVTDVYVIQGETVVAGQALIRLDDTLLMAQRELAAAGWASAQAALDTARAALDTARIQYQQVLETARLAEDPARAASLGASQPSDFELPPWYFSKEEQIAAMEAEVDDAAGDLEIERERLRVLLNDPDYADVLAAEQRVAQARAAYLTAQDALTQAKAFGDSDLIDAAQTQFDSAKQELEDAQKAYDDLLQTDQGRTLLEARARVRAAEQRYYAALDRLARLHTGEDSYAVKLAAAAVQQSESAVTQAEKALAQAQAQLDSIDAQIGMLTVTAPSDGTVIERDIEPGVMAVAGSTALVIGRLDQLTITVYIPEDIYGKIRLGQSVDIAVDSFPGRVFTGTVTRIADEAEFTPRNVQTEEGRRTTVFAVEITVHNPGPDLKPGMPADVTFVQ